MSITIPPLPWLTIDRLRSSRDIRLSTATMKALNPRRPQPSTFHLFPGSFLCLLLLLFVVHDGGARSVHRDQEDPVQSKARFLSAAEKIEDTTKNWDDVMTLLWESNSKHLEKRFLSSPLEHEGRKGDEELAAKTRKQKEAAAEGKSDEQKSEGKQAEERAKDEGIRRFDLKVEPEIAETKSKSNPKESAESEQSGESKSSSESKESNSAEESKELLPSYYVKSATLENKDPSSEESVETDENREPKSVLDSQSRSRRKSSTVYLNAEEKKLPEGEQQSIVEGQIKKLISIRDDALDARKTEELSETKLLGSRPEVQMDAAALTPGEVPNEPEDKVKHARLSSDSRQLLGSNLNFLEKWRDQAVSLQEQIKNRTFLLSLKEQVTEVLPEIPKFSDNQLLDTLEQIVLLKRSELLNNSHASGLKDLALTNVQLQIIKCAEQLVAVRDRQSFTTNLSNCIRGFSVWNCLKIFVWPIIVDNLPNSIKESLANVPIEINVIDLFQGNRQKSGRAHDLQQVLQGTPEAVVYNILEDALGSYPNEEQIPYANPNNGALSKLLPPSQLNILHLAARFVPLSFRAQFWNGMYSCVNRFDYFSCVKYYAWPTIKQYVPTLPPFPDQQTWYPLLPVYPQYPSAYPSPSYSEPIGDLPEVVDADATRSRKPSPEAVISEVLQDTLDKQPKFYSSASLLDQSTSAYSALLPRDQLLTINMAGQLIPAAFRTEFVDKTVRCIQQFNYLYCFRYWTWPTVRQFIPNLPDIFDTLPDFRFPGPSDLFILYPNFQHISIPYSSPVLDTQLISESIYTTYVKGILEDARNSSQQASELPYITANRNGVALSEEQFEILRLAMSLVPSPDDLELYNQVLDCIPKNKEVFSTCVKNVIWPTVSRYVPQFPTVPQIPRILIDSANVQGSLDGKEGAASSGENVQERINLEAENEKITSRIPMEDKESRSKIPENVPVISVTGTRFVPIFTEHPETVIYNILKSVQLQAHKMGKLAFNVSVQGGNYSLSTSGPSLDFLTEIQKQIVNTVASLIPEALRTKFINDLIACLQKENFVTCTRTVIWPLLQGYIPWLPNFPNFLIGSGSPSSGSTASTSAPPLTETSSDAPRLSETNVKTGQHGNTIVTVTDTRFFPIFIEQPETVLLNILKAVQLSTPNILGPVVPLRTQEFANLLTEQQINLIQMAENLLPVPVRTNFISTITACVRQSDFLDCTRNITWPLVMQSYPWLTRFPNFGKYPNLPRIGIQVFLTDKPSTSKLEEQTPSKKEEVPLQVAQDNIENILSQTMEKSISPLGQSYLLDVNSVSHLSEQQVNIIKLIERGIPDEDRASYVARILDCTKSNGFMDCTQQIGWPTLRQYYPFLSDFPSATQYPIIIESIVQRVPDGPQKPYPPLPSPPTIIDYKSLQAINPERLSEPAATNEERGQIYGTPAITPSVDTEGAVPGYAGQPPGIYVDISKEKVQLPDDDQQYEATLYEAKSRTRRDTVELFNSYYDADETQDTSSSSTKTFPNITESEYLQLLIRIKEDAQKSSTRTTKPDKYFVDTLNSTVRNSLTADQYEILKMVEDVGGEIPGRGLATQVIRCIWSLSFIRCLGIFIWPLIVSNLPTFIPSFGVFGRALDTEKRVQEFFGLSTNAFERELLVRKESIESFLLDWYRNLVEEEFETNVGFLKVRGYGNGKLGISCARAREARGAKLKDNKNLPSILTIISDIMEEVLDQRPDGEKGKKEKEKKERSIDEARDSDIQFLKDSEEYGDIKRSMNDDEIISMFLNKIKSNDSEAENDKESYFGLEDAYNAFGVLFGTRLHGRLSNKLQTQQLRSLDEAEPPKEVVIVPLESVKSSDELKVLPLSGQVTYDFEKETIADQEERQREKRAKSIKSFLENYSDLYLNDADVESSEDIEDNKIRNSYDRYEKDSRSSLVVELPRLDKEIVSRKMTHSMEVLGRAMKTKMMEMMPGVGLIISFLLQTALAHARAAASMAGMISNMALGSAMVGMIRDSLFGSNSHPQIKYVYDNDKTGPGISWQTSQYAPGYHYHG